MDVTPELLKECFESGRLGALSTEIPDVGSISVDLPQFYNHATSAEGSKRWLKPEDIESVVVFGSVLYKHFPQEEEIITRKKWFLFGPTIEKVVLKSRQMPNDFDVMVITTEGFTKDKIVIPRVTVPKIVYGTCSANGCEGEGAVIETKRVAWSGYGYVEVFGGSNFHISYRSVEQLLNGLGKGDTVSESVISYGLPIIGKSRFEDIIDSVDFPERNPLHWVQWDKGFGGVLQGRIL
ncbi:MAG: hypothetical protein GOU97_03370 [Nanoarchaeota archaeon]|nr:hypothetical protein [Nanoarchaeota archaeon]